MAKPVASASQELLTPDEFIAQLQDAKNEERDVAQEANDMSRNLDYEGGFSYEQIRRALSIFSGDEEVVIKYSVLNLIMGNRYRDYPTLNLEQIKAICNDFPAGFLSYSQRLDKVMDIFRAGFGKLDPQLASEEIVELFQSGFSDSKIRSEFLGIAIPHLNKNFSVGQFSAIAQNFTDPKSQIEMLKLFFPTQMGTGFGIRGIGARVDISDYSGFRKVLDYFCSHADRLRDNYDPDGLYTHREVLSNPNPLEPDIQVTTFSRQFDYDALIAITRNLPKEFRFKASEFCDIVEKFSRYEGFPISPLMEMLAIDNGRLGERLSPDQIQSIRTKASPAVFDTIEDVNRVLDKIQTMPLAQDTSSAAAAADNVSAAQRAPGAAAAASAERLAGQQQGRDDRIE